MVGKAESVKSSLPKFFSPLRGETKLNLRKLIVLTLGLANHDMTLQQLHTMTKNLAHRLKSHIPYHVPDLSTFSELVSKLYNHGILKQSYDISKKGYRYQLTEKGEGEYDMILYNTSHLNFSPKFKEFKELVKFAF